MDEWYVSVFFESNKIGISGYLLGICSMGCIFVMRSLWLTACFGLRCMNWFIPVKKRPTIMIIISQPNFVICLLMMLFSLLAVNHYLIFYSIFEKFSTMSAYRSHN